MVKLPKTLLWDLIAKIVDDLNLDNIINKDYILSNDSINDSYKLIYCLILIFLGQTQPIRKSKCDGISDDVSYMNLDKTIAHNTLYDCKVYGKKYSYNWSCQEHNIFVQALKICESHFNKGFKSDAGVIKLLNSFYNISHIDLDYISCDDVDYLLQSLSCEYDFESGTINPQSLFLVNEKVYKNLCMLSYLVLKCENTNIDDSGASGINFNKLEWYIMQQYGIRQITNTINNMRSYEDIESKITNKRHSKYQLTIYDSNSSTMRPDAVYMFDDSGYNDTIVDVKLYSSICVSNNKYTQAALRNQMIAYKMAYPNFISSYKEKRSRKSITINDVNAWLIHFRYNATQDEKNFSGSFIAEDFCKIGVYIVNFDKDSKIKDLDEQIKNFVLNHIFMVKRTENRLKQFKNTLKKYGLTKCYVSEGFDFEAECPDGTIEVNSDNSELIYLLYNLFTIDGFVSEGQELFIWSLDDKHVENFTV